MLKSVQQLKYAAQIFKVLGNSYRLQIVSILLQGEKNVSELNALIKVSQPALSQHLSKLRAAGVLSARRDQRQIYYSILNPVVVRLLGLMDEASPENNDVLKRAQRG